MLFNHIFVEKNYSACEFSDMNLVNEHRLP